MSKSSHPFVRFLNLYRTMNECDHSHQGKPLHPEAVAILAYISSNDESGKHTTISHIVKKNEFGAPPTVQRRIHELLGCKLIEFYTGIDRRHRLLRVSPAGEKYLQDCSDLMLEALAKPSTAF